MKRTITLLQIILLFTNLNATILLANRFNQVKKDQPKVIFKENKGQICDQFYKPRPDILFSGNAGKLSFYLKNNGVSYQLSKVNSWRTTENNLNKKLIKSNLETKSPDEILISRIDITWVNANTNALIIKEGQQENFDNYYSESCPNGVLGVRNYNEIIYKNIYPGIDLKWFEKDGNLKYDYVVAANADYKKILLEINGAEKISINAQGELVIQTGLGDLIEQKPKVRQFNKDLDAEWLVVENKVSFHIKNVDESHAFVIDPLVRLWGTYFGGALEDNISYNSIDAVGNVFITGNTKSISNIVTSGAYQTVNAGGSTYGDAFVSKFNSSGILLWSTYYGGAGDDYGNNCLSDNMGNVFLYGRTTTSNTSVMTSSGAHQTSYSNLTTNTGDGFLAKFDLNGARLWATYYGGDMPEYCAGLATDNNGNVIICGQSSSTNNISSPGSHQVNLIANNDCYIAKFNSSGILQWGTYYGGNGYAESSFECMTDNSGNILVTGFTKSTNGISTPGCHQAVYGGGPTYGDAFIAKFAPTGVLQWGTYYGGASDDCGISLSVDSLKNIYVCGFTATNSGTIIATPGSHQSIYGGGTVDAFFVKFDSTGQRQWGSYYGGLGDDYGTDIAQDYLGNIFLLGSSSTNSGTSIATPCTYQSNYGGGSSDAYFAKFNPLAQRLWGTYYGDIYTDYGSCGVVDIHGNIYISGYTFANSGSVFSSSNGYQPIYGGGTADGFLAKFDGCIPTPAINLTPPSNLLVCEGDSTTLYSSCGNWYSSPTNSLVLSTSNTFTIGSLYSDTTFYIEDIGCGLMSGTRTAISVTVASPPTLSITNSNPLACIGETITLTVSGVTSYTWAPPPSTNSAPLNVFVFVYKTYSVTGEDANGCVNTATILIAPEICSGLETLTNFNSEITTFPNPNEGAVTIKSSLQVSLILTNELGQKIRTIQLTSANNFRITLEGLAPGVYFLADENKNLQVNQKIVVISP